MQNYKVKQEQEYQRILCKGNNNQNVNTVNILSKIILIRDINLNAFCKKWILLEENFENLPDCDHIMLTNI